MSTQNKLSVVWNSNFRNICSYIIFNYKKLHCNYFKKHVIVIVDMLTVLWDDVSHLKFVHFSYPPHCILFMKTSCYILCSWRLATDMLFLTTRCGISSLELLYFTFAISVMFISCQVIQWHFFTSLTLLFPIHQLF